MRLKKEVIGQKYLPYPVVQHRGETFDELLNNIYEAVEGCLSVDIQDIKVSPKDKIMEIAV
jgi:predicted RNase H-like HicB family nuclease